MRKAARDHQLLYITFLAFVLIGLPNGALNVAWIHMQATFGLPLDALGVLLGAITLGRLLLSVFSGRMIRWLAMDRYLLAGSLVMLLGLGGFILTPSWLLLVLSAFVFSAGSAMLNTGVNTFAAARFDSGRMNWLHAWYGFGSALGPLLVTLVVIDMGLDWRWAYVALAGLQALMIVLVMVTLSAWRLSMPGKSADSRPVMRMRDTLRIGAVWFGVALFFLHGGIQIGTGQLGNSLLVEGRGLDPRVVGMWVSIYWMGLTIGRILTGIFVGWVGNTLLLRLSMLGTVAGVLLLWLRPSDGLSFVGMALMGLTLGPILPTLLADTHMRVGAGHAPNTIGFEIAASGVGLALLPGLAAVIAERAGLEMVGPFLLLLAVLSLVVYEMMVMQERHRRQPAPQMDAL